MLTLVEGVGAVAVLVIVALMDDVWGGAIWPKNVGSLRHRIVLQKALTPRVTIRKKIDQ